MKTKSLAIIFILFLLITLVSAGVVYLTSGKKAPVWTAMPLITDEQPDQIEIENQATSAPANQAKPIAQEAAPEAKTDKPAVEEISVSLVIAGSKYDVKVPAGFSVYDLMEKLKQENKINFSGKNYPDLGFFVEEINGVKNDPIGKNWIYYVNGQPANVGSSYYKLKDGDVIEWKYEKKSF